MSRPSTRPQILEGGPLRYAPENELGVVFLFSHVAKKWRLRIEQIRPGFPDCIAYQRTDRGEKRLRIEFEFRSKNFKVQRHSARGCDWIVCWEHNWPGVPKRLQVKELRRHFGLGFNVWILPVRKKYQNLLKDRVVEWWSLPSRASKDDILLFYYTHPDTCIKNVFRLGGEVRPSKRWKFIGGPIHKIADLEAPIFFKDMRRDRILSTAGFVRAQIRGRRNATEYWPYLYEKIVGRNPSIKRKLAKYAPERLA